MLGPVMKKYIDAQAKQVKDKDAILPEIRKQLCEQVVSVSLLWCRKVIARFGKMSLGRFQRECRYPAYVRFLLIDTDHH